MGSLPFKEDHGDIRGKEGGVFSPSVLKAGHGKDTHDFLPHGLKDDLPFPVGLVPGYIKADLAVKSLCRPQDAHVDIAVFFFGNIRDNEGNGTGYPFAQGAGALVKAIAKPGGRVFYHPDFFVADAAASVQDV